MERKNINLKNLSRERGMLFSEVRSVLGLVNPDARVVNHNVLLSEEKYDDLIEELDSVSLPVLIFYSSDRAKHILVMAKENNSYSYLWYCYRMGNRQFMGKKSVKDFEKDGYLEADEERNTDIYIENHKGDLIGVKPLYEYIKRD